MLCIAVANIKGGTGKTTLSTHIAAYFAASGRSTVLADLDRQRSAFDWASRRPLALPRIAALDLSRSWAPPQGYERVVFDLPAGMKRKDLELVVYAVDAIVIPVTPGVFDERGTIRFLDQIADIKPVKKGRRPIGMVANRIRAKAAASRLDAFLAGLGSPTVAHLKDSATIADAAVTGVTVFDRGNHAAREPWNGLVRFLDDLG